MKKYFKRIELTRIVFLFGCIVALLVACDKTIPCFVCDKEQQEKAAKFVTDNMKSANNMSDEEMEDVIKELTRSAVRLNCSQEFLPASFDNIIRWDEIKKDSTKTYYQ